MMNICIECGHILGFDKVALYVSMSLDTEISAALHQYVSFFYLEKPDIAAAFYL
jgi:hypothetical protein